MTDQPVKTKKKLKVGSKLNLAPDGHFYRTVDDMMQGPNIRFLARVSFPPGPVHVRVLGFRYVQRLGWLINIDIPKSVYEEGWVSLSNIKGVTVTEISYIEGLQVPVQHPC